MVWSIDRKTLHPVLIPLPVHKPQLTDISVNGQTYQPTDRKGNPYSIDYSSKITLKNPKRFTLYFSAMNFAQGGSDKYAYRLEPTLEEWVALTSDVSSVSFLDLQPGSYRFSVYLLDATGSPPGRIRPNARHRRTAPAVGLRGRLGPLYSLLLLTIAAYVVYSIRLRQMHFEKEILLAQYSSKIAFLANIFHDLKTSLSLIIGLVSQIMLSVRDKTLHPPRPARRRETQRRTHQLARQSDPRLQGRGCRRRPLHSLDH